MSEASIQLSDKELFLLGSLLGIQSIVGLEDPFLGHLIEDIQEEWEIIKPKLVEKGYLVENQEGIQVEEHVRKIISTCGSAQILRFYYASEQETVDKYFYINKNIVEKEQVDFNKPILKLKLLEHMDEIWGTIQPTFEQEQENGQFNDIVTIHLIDNMFQTARQLIRENKQDELEELLSKTEHYETLIQALTTIKGEGQITFMKWDGEGWIVRGKAYLITESHNWIVNFMDGDRLELVTKTHREIAQEVNQIIKLVTL